MLLRHRNNRDVAIEVIKHYYAKGSSKPFKLKVRWWNIGYSHSPWPMNIEQRLELENLHDWLPYSWPEGHPPPEHKEWTPP